MRETEDILEFGRRRNRGRGAGTDRGRCGLGNALNAVFDSLDCE